MALPIYLLWPPPLLFCPLHTSYGSVLSRSLMPSSFLQQLCRAGSYFWVAPNPSHLSQCWDGAVYYKKLFSGFTQSHQKLGQIKTHHIISIPIPQGQQTNWQQRRQSQVKHYEQWNGMTPELTGSELLCNDFGIQERITLQHWDSCSHSHCSKNLCQMEHYAKVPARNLTKPLPFLPEKSNTKENTFKRFLTASLKNKEWEQRTTIAQLLPLDWVVWNNVGLLPSNIELMAGLATT